MKRLSPILLLLLIGISTAAQQSTGETAPPRNSLSELRDLRNALLVVSRSRVLDVSDHDAAIVEDVLKTDPVPKGRYRWVYSQLARKLNKYIKKYKSLSAASQLADADYVIFFNVVEFRRILNTFYPFGELFVIVKGSPDDLKPPRVVWRARKLLIAEDAMSELIKDLKAFRGES
jgi:hypothetical protein